MACTTCDGSPLSGSPASQPSCNDIPSSLVTCFSGQSLPPELPTTGIPASAVSYTPPAGGCIPSAATIQEYLDKIATLYFSLFCPAAIAGTSGNCSVLRIVNNKVVAATFSSIFDECMGCIAVAKLCPGNAGDVIQMVAGVPVWAPLPVPPTSTALTCAAVTTVLAGAGCIPTGTIAQNMGFNTAGALVKAAPSTPATTAITCAEFTPLLSSCPADSTDPAPAKLLGYDATGNPEKWSACSVVTGAINRLSDASLSGACISDGVGSSDMMMGYDLDTKRPEWFAPRQRYLTEMRGSQARVQTLSTVPQTLNNIISHWEQSYERGLLLGQPTWYNPTTGRVTIGRSGWYRVSFTGLMVRIRPNAIATPLTIGHIYAGITVVRAAGTIDGTAYPGLAAVLRTGESPVVANGKDQDYVFSGEYFGPLAQGDQLWIRVVCSNVPDNALAIQALSVQDDGSSSWTVAEESTYTYHLV